MGEGEKKNTRQRGGFALVEVMDDGKTLVILSPDLEGQKECRAELIDKVGRGQIQPDGQRTFGIIQVKVTDLVPKLKPAAVTL